MIFFLPHKLKCIKGNAKSTQTKCWEQFSSLRFLLAETTPCCCFVRPALLNIHAQAGSASLDLYWQICIQAFRNDTWADRKSQPCVHKHCLVYHCLLLFFLFPLSLTLSLSYSESICLRGDHTQTRETRGEQKETGLLTGKIVKTHSFTLDPSIFSCWYHLTYSKS